MFNAAGEEMATGEQLLIHVSLKTRRACAPTPEVLARVEAMAEAHATLPRPDSA